MKNAPSIILGTAMWGWTVDKSTVFSLMDKWYECGYREVDTATNYPIDKNPQHFRLAEQLLLDWIKTNGVSDLKVIVKIGSVNNLFTPEHVLTKSFMLMMMDEYRHLFGENLDTLMVHWDNRSSESEIADTLESFKAIIENGLNLGLSGIKHPDLYANQNEAFGFDWRIQIKHNVLYSDYHRYAAFHGSPRFIAYGINAGGLKLDPAAYSASSNLKARGGDIKNEPIVMNGIRNLIAEVNQSGGLKPITSFNQIGMIHAFHHADMQAILLGTSNIDQLAQSIDFYQLLKNGGYGDVFRSLQNILLNHQQ